MEHRRATGGAQLFAKCGCSGDEAACPRHHRSGAAAGILNSGSTAKILAGAGHGLNQQFFNNLLHFLPDRLDLVASRPSYRGRGRKKGGKENPGLGQAASTVGGLVSIFSDRRLSTVSARWVNLPMALGSISSLISAQATAQKASWPMKLPSFGRGRLAPQDCGPMQRSVMGAL